MSGFLTTVLNLGQNFFTCLPIAGRAWNGRGGGGLPSRRVRADSPGTWLPVGTKGSPQALPHRGWGGSQREAFYSVEVLIFLVGQPWPDMPCRLSGRKPTSQTHASWVSGLCVGRLSVVDWRKNLVHFLETVFKNPEIYSYKPIRHEYAILSFEFIKVCLRRLRHDLSTCVESARLVTWHRR